MNFIRVLKTRSRVPSVILESLDPASALSAGILNALALAVFFVGVMGLTVVVPFFAVRKAFGYALVSVTMAACVTSWYGLHSLAHDSAALSAPVTLARRVRSCGWILVSTLWCVAAALVLLNGGIRSRALTVFVGAIVASGGILGRKVAILAALVFLAFSLVLAILELSGISLPHYMPGPPVTVWYILIFVAVLATFPLVQLFSSIGDLLARLHTILETAPDAIFIVNPDGRIVDVNQSALRQLGYTKKELVGVHVTEFVKPEFHARVRSRFPEISGPTFYESCHLRRDGTEIPVELNTCRIVFHGQPALLAIARDLTARRRAHERLQALNGQLLTAQEEERRRIARDLHDDITQRIAGLSMELGMLRKQENADLAGSMRVCRQLSKPSADRHLFKGRSQSTVPSTACRTEFPTLSPSLFTGSRRKL
jgi:PAS domain S-box-containing protein